MLTTPPQAAGEFSRYRWWMDIVFAASNGDAAPSVGGCDSVSAALKGDLAPPLGHFVLWVFRSFFAFPMPRAVTTAFIIEKEK